MNIGKWLEEARDNISYNINECYLSVHSFIERVAGTLAYMRFIWQSHAYREWDYEYLYILIEYKLKRMALQLRKDSYVESSESTYNEILHALAYLHIYKEIEMGEHNHNDPDVIREICRKEQEAWNDFHDYMKEHAQSWWS